MKIPRTPLHLVDYAFRALGREKLPIQQLIFFLSFDIRQMPPSQAQKLVQELQSKGQLEIANGLVKLTTEITQEPNSKVTTSKADLGELLRLFVSSSRLSRAVGISDDAIEFIRVENNPLQIEATVHGSQDYVLKLDEETRQITHNCPDWRKVSVLHRFCKHVAKLFLLMQKDEAIRILKSVQQESWDFDLI
ncbi:MAG: DUF2240 family protein [Candidatus Thorarchaeota archaeon]